MSTVPEGMVVFKWRRGRDENQAGDFWEVSFSAFMLASSGESPVIGIRTILVGVICVASGRVVTTMVR